MNAPVTLFSADIILPVTGPPVRDGAVAVRDGRILHVGERSWVRETLHDRGLESEERHLSGVLVPGLVNAHTHLQYTGMASVATGRYHGFDDWGDAFDAAYGAGGHDWGAAAADGARRSLAAGVTAAADVVTDPAAASALHDAGMHGAAYWEVYGLNNADWGDGGRDRLVAQLAAVPTPPAVGVSPHAPYSLEITPLLEVPDVAREHGLRLHIHLAEAHMENGDGLAAVDWQAQRPESFRALRGRGVGISSTEFVDHLGVLGPDCHIAHGVYVNAKDRALLRARGTSVALCPRSNEVIGLDMPPVAAYLAEGNAIAVGTDSLASSPSLDLMADVAALYRIARQQGYAEADLHARLLQAATLGGATAVGAHAGPARIGQLAVGAAADLAGFEVDTVDTADALAELVEAGEGRCVMTVLSGRQLSGNSA
ncbi:amidohydrolase family protein [Mycetocola reblochoni]|uniref:Possible chlorohydrolase-like protein n=2 Tax=Mycetocola reblochoni TaxID=331618 RepID=A0A1R4JKH6_9MICO|nr:amidohydrolase family protein [Mycetocola reblochoni]RLP69204.1 cytosine deaminase [Mycetocola reblochoni]SJN32518.1 possible chlorohydrolase-like protein [Mycetocola reblochoni REB411]